MSKTPRHLLLPLWHATWDILQQASVSAATGFLQWHTRYSNDDREKDYLDTVNISSFHIFDNEDKVLPTALHSWHMTFRITFIYK